MKIKFLGAARTVTGSKTLVSYNGKKILIDCGLFQGPKEVRNLNWEPFQLAKEIDAVILTHAHIDHSGFIPRLVKDGFRGKIYCTEPTFELCKIMLPDSGYLQEEDARFANKTRHSRHYPALPLYTEAEAEVSLSHFHTLSSDAWHELFKGLSLRFLRAGHILGSSIVQLNLAESNHSRLITFSGDLGNGRSNILKEPMTIHETDYLVIESTYGDRVQDKKEVDLKLANIIKRVLGRGGTLVIPAFAVGRTQDLLFLLRSLEERGLIPVVPVYLDSPMAQTATEIYRKYQDEMKIPLNANDPFEFKTNNFKITRSADESMLLTMDSTPKIIISAAGMLTGGRVLHHLKAHLPREESAVLFVGYQAAGTKGLLLKNGLKTIRIHHQEVTVEAEIISFESLSAHADSDELIQWFKAFEKKPSKVFLNHGEVEAMRALQYRIKHECGCDVIIPDINEEFVL